MRGRALSALLLACASAFACNALTGAGDLTASETNAVLEAGVGGDGAGPVPTTTSTATVDPPPLDGGADAAEAAALVDAGHDASVDAGHDAGVDAGRDAGAPVLTGTFGGHRYEVVLLGAAIDWDDAKFAAETKGGHLAALTTAAENDFVRGLVNNAADSVNGGIDGAWLGGFQGADPATPDAEWQWVTGEEWDYTNWAIGEPNDGGGEEDYLGIFPGDGVWNDYRLNGDAAVPCYVIEYDK